MATKIQYDRGQSEALCSEARTAALNPQRCVHTVNLRAMADQLEAAQAEIARMRLESFTEATTTLALSNSNQAKDEHIETLTAERDKLRRELDATRTILSATERTVAGGDEALRTLRAQWQAERDKLRAEAEAMRPVIEAAVRVAELDEICDAHPGITDEVGQRAESELYDAVKARTAAVDAYRAARDKAGG